MKNDDVNIRYAHANDIHALTQFARDTYAHAFGTSMTDKDLSDHLDTYLSTEQVSSLITDDVVLLAEIAGVLVGYVHLSEISFEVDTPDNESKSLRRLYVHPDYQNQGIGSMLLDAALRTPLLKNARYVYLDVWEKNIAAQRLYEGYGFKRVGEIRYVHPSGEEGDFDYILRRDNHTI